MIVIAVFPFRQIIHFHYSCTIEDSYLKNLTWFLRVNSVHSNRQEGARKPTLSNDGYIEHEPAPTSRA